LKAKEPRDRSASVRARLLNLARDRGEDFQITLRNYLFERFLYRLSRSELRERFVLKVAMLLRLWADQPYRATVDLDLLSRGNPDPDSVARDITAICRTGVPDDAVVFDASTISVESIRAQEDRQGIADPCRRDARHPVFDVSRDYTDRAIEGKRHRSADDTPSQRQFRPAGRG
jgi:hypothetical protein